MKQLFTLLFMLCCLSLSAQKNADQILKELETPGPNGATVTVHQSEMYRNASTAAASLQAKAPEAIVFRYTQAMPVNQHARKHSTSRSTCLPSTLNSRSMSHTPHHSGKCA